jgi:Fur family transcriptional regulator, peroxide stress response regulator
MQAPPDPSNRGPKESPLMTKEEMVQTLRRKGLKVTPQRLAIIDVLIENRSMHPTASQVYREGKKHYRGLSLSTVYATLHEFSRQGLLKTIEFDQMENRYEVNLEEHVNLICQDCGRIIDYPAPPAVDPSLIKKNTGFQVRHTRMDYYGYCEECLRKKALASPRRGPSGGIF